MGQDVLSVNHEIEREVDRGNPTGSSEGTFHREKQLWRLGPLCESRSWRGGLCSHARCAERFWKRGAPDAVSASRYVRRKVCRRHPMGEAGLENLERHHGAEKRGVSGWGSRVLLFTQSWVLGWA